MLVHAFFKSVIGEVKRQAGSAEILTQFANSMRRI